MSDYHQPQRYESTPADSLVGTVKMLLIDTPFDPVADDVKANADWLWMNTPDGAPDRPEDFHDLDDDSDPFVEVSPRDLIHALVAEIARLVRPLPKDDMG